MCGISGIYNLFNKDINSKKIIEKIIKIQNSRGPDGNAMWISDCKKIILGHNRLSIIDLSDKARQPFISKDKNFTITFNGEIYNYKEIKKELIQKDIIFKSNSDTEVIVEAYKYWGLESLKKFRGMFSFALWDIQKHKLILARDPLGIKPLYYTNKNGVIYFASQIKSLLSIDGINLKKNETSIVSFYLWGNVQDPSTLYSDINSVEKGTCKIINENGKEKTFVYNNLKDLFLNSEPITFNNKTDEVNSLKSLVIFFDDMKDLSDLKKIGDFDARLEIVSKLVDLYFKDYYEEIDNREYKKQASINTSSANNILGYSYLQYVLYALAVYALAVLYLMIFKVEIDLRRIPTAINEENDS